MTAQRTCLGIGRNPLGVAVDAPQPGLRGFDNRRVLSGAEKAAISSYTGLNHGTFTKDRANLLSGLEKLPAVKATVFRFARYTTAMDYWVEGSTMGFSHPTSTTRNKPFREFGGEWKAGSPKERIMLMQIQTCSGRNIAGLSHYPKENEVLIPPGARFSVVRRVDRANACYVELKELPSGST